jgi:hypothetical protein
MLSVTCKCLHLSVQLQWAESHSLSDSSDVSSPRIMICLLASLASPTASQFHSPSLQAFVRSGNPSLSYSVALPSSLPVPLSMRIGRRVSDRETVRRLDSGPFTRPIFFVCTGPFPGVTSSSPFASSQSVLCLGFSSYIHMHLDMIEGP